MKNKIRILSIILVTAILIGAGIFLYLKSRKFNRHIKILLKNEISEYLDRSVEIDRISTDIFNQLILNEVWIIDTKTTRKIIQVRKIKIKYSFFKFIKKIRNISDLIQEITLYNPKFTVLRSPKGITVDGLENIFRSRKGKSHKIPSWKLNVIDGRINVQGVNRREFILKDFDAELFLGGYPEFHIKTSFEIEKFIGRINIESKFHALTNEFTARITGKNIKLERLGKISLRNKEYEFDTGSGNLDLQVKGNIEQLKKNFGFLKVYGDIKIRNASLETVAIPAVDINISPERIKIEKGILKWGRNSVNLTGYVEDYFDNPYMLLTLKGAIQAQQLLKLVKIKEKAEGIFEVNGLIEGSPGNIIAKGNLYMDSGSISKFNLKQLNTYLIYEKNRIRFSSSSVNIADGKIMWEGDWEPEGKINLRGNAKGLAISRITGIRNIKGDLSGDVAVTGDMNYPEFRTEVIVDELIISGREFGHIAFKGSYKDLKIKFDGFTLDGKYSTKGKLVLVKKDNMFKIEKFLISGLDQGKVQVKGNLRYAPLGAELSIKANGIDVEDTFVLKKIYPESAGSFNFDGKIEYNRDILLTRGRLSTDNFSLNNEKYTLECFLEARAKDNISKFTISELNLNNYLAGMVEIEKYPDKVFIKRSSFSAVAANLKQLMVLFKKDININRGSLTGNMYYAHPEGKGDFTIKDMQLAKVNVGNLSCSITSSSEGWNIEELYIKKKEGEVTAKGSVYPIQDITIEFSDYDIKGRIIDGSGKYKGRNKIENGYKKYEFNADFDNLKLKKNKWPQLILKGAFKERELYAQLNIGEKIKGEITSIFDVDRRLEIDIWIKKFEFQKILDVLNISANFKGVTSGSLKIFGKVNNPIVVFEGALKDGNWRYIPFQANGVMEYQGGQLKFENVKGDIGEAGYFKINGVIDSNSQIKAAAKIEKFDCRLLSKNFRKIGKIEGFFDLNLEVTGHIEEPVVNIAAQGSNIVIGKFFAKKINVKAKYSDKKALIDNIEVLYKNGKANFMKGEIDFAQPAEPDIAIKGNFKNIRIGPVTILGDARIKGKIGLEPFYAKLEVVPDTLLVNRYDLKSSLKIDYKEGALKLNVKDGINSRIYIDKSGEIIIENLDMDKGSKMIRGKGSFKKGEFSGVLQARNIQINNIIRLLDSPIDYDGSSTFDINIKSNEEGIYAFGSISVTDNRYKEIKFDNLDCEFKYSDGTLNLTNTSLTDARFMDIKVEGKLGSQSDFKIMVNRISLSLLEDLSAEINKARGYFKGEFNIKGSLEQPLISGSMSLTGGKIVGKDIIGKITSIDCEIKAKESKVKLEKLSAIWKPGRITGEGYMDLKVRPVIIKLEIKTEGDNGVAIKVPYLDIPQSAIFGRFLTLPSHGELKGKISFYNMDGDYYLKGDIILNNTHFTYPPAKGSKRAPSSTFLDDIILDINLKAGKSVWYENTQVRVKVSGESGELNFKKYPGKPIIVNGEVTSNQGEVTYLNRNFNIKEAKLRFEDSVEYLSAEAVIDIQRKIEDGQWDDDLIEMVIPPGRIADIAPNFRSSKYREKTSSEEALELAITGINKDLTQEERNALLRKELLRAIDANLTSPLVKNILKRTDLIDVAKVDIRVSDNTLDRTLLLEGAGIELGRYFTDKLYMGYYMLFRGGVENKLRLTHELDVLYRLQGSQFLRGRISQTEKFFLGFEQQIRF